jgi:hypothetical protein
LLSFIYVYFFESRLFNGLRPIQTKKFRLPAQVVFNDLSSFLFSQAGPPAGSIDRFIIADDHRAGFGFMQENVQIILESFTPKRATPDRPERDLRRPLAGNRARLSYRSASAGRNLRPSACCYEHSTLRPQTASTARERRKLSPGRSPGYAHKKPREACGLTRGEAASLWEATPLAKLNNSARAISFHEARLLMSAARVLDIVKPRSSL